MRGYSMDKTAYCPMPFVTLTVNPTGVMTRCMMSMKNMGPISKSTYSSNSFKKLRKDMLNGKWDEDGCFSCKNAEEGGRLSQRKKWLDREERYLGRTGIYEENTSIVKNDIYHLYMNFNNICNFKCRMCGPHFSNAWIPDHNKLAEVTKIARPWLDQSMQKQRVDVDNFFEQFGDMISNLKQIWITGGEPFMDDSIYKFFDKLGDYADLKSIKVVINTNATKVDPAKLIPLMGVKLLALNISVDATGKLFPYMRGYNYSFDQMDAKIRSICKLKKSYKNFQVQVNAAYQIFNILNVEDFYNWSCEILDDPTAGLLEYRTLSGPPFLRARNAPNDIKQDGLAMLERLLKRFPDNVYIPDMIKEVKQEQNKKDIEDFVLWNKKLDEIRSEHLVKAFPQLVKSFNLEGIKI